MKGKESRLTVQQSNAIQRRDGKALTVDTSRRLIPEELHQGKGKRKSMIEAPMGFNLQYTTDWISIAGQ